MITLQKVVLSVPGARWILATPVTVICLLSAVTIAITSMVLTEFTGWPAVLTSLFEVSAFVFLHLAGRNYLARDSKLFPVSREEELVFQTEINTTYKGAVLVIALGILQILRLLQDKAGFPPPPKK